MVLIDNINTLFSDIQSYKEMFPDTYTEYENIKEIVNKHYNDPVGSMFGIEVSKTWLNKCYGFEVDKVESKRTIIRYIGIYKT